MTLVMSVCGDAGYDDGDVDDGDVVDVDNGVDNVRY